MRKIMYEDCNNNATFLKGLLIQIQALSDTELSWSASNLDLVENIRSIYAGEFVTASNGEQIKIKVFDGDIVYNSHFKVKVKNEWKE